MARLTKSALVDVLAGKQERVLAVSLTILHLGTGLSYSLLALYLVRHVHLDPALYGVGMSVAAFLGLASGPVVGHLSDRVNGYRLYAFLVWMMSVATAAVIFSGPWLALGLLSVLTICGRGGAAVLGAIVGRTVPRERRVRYRAVVKSLTNAAMVAGLGLGALVLLADSALAFQIGFAAEAVTLVVVGLLVWLAAPRSTGKPVEATGQASKPEPGRSRFAVLKDRRFAVLVVLNCVLTVSESMLTIALPLWVSTRMQVPLWVVSVAMVIYTGGVVLLQIPASRKVSDLSTSSRAGRRGGVLLALTAAMFPVAAIAHDGPVAVAAIVVLALALVGGEVFYSAGSWGLVYNIAPEDKLGQYQGVYGIGWDVSMLVGPALFAFLASGQSLLGWAVLAMVFLVAALLLVPVSAMKDTSERAVATTG